MDEIAKVFHNLHPSFKKRPCPSFWVPVKFPMKLTGRQCGGVGDGSLARDFGPGSGKCDACHGERLIQPPPGAFLLESENHGKSGGNSHGFD